MFVIRPRRLLLALLALPLVAAASSEDEVNAVLGLAEAPPGVVFEVVSGSETRLVELTPQLKRFAARLRARFPDLEIALVTHGSEQFSLLSANAHQYPDLHREVAALTEQQAIPVHVCGNHASWRDNVPDDFPAYVDVAPSAGGQLRHYAERGFVLIVL